MRRRGEPAIAHNATRIVRAFTSHRTSHPWHNRQVNGETALAATATLVASAFCLSTLERWLARRRPHELAWTISLALFAGASGALWLGAADGWTPATFRVFFLLGAILNVPWLALGTVYLLAGPVAGDRWRRGVSFFSAFAPRVVLTTPLTRPLPPPDPPPGPGGVRL